MQNLTELFQDTLKDVYYAEKALVKMLPKLAKKASSEELKTALTEHAEETEGQVQRLDKIFKSLGMRSQGKECPAMKGLMEETEETVTAAKDSSVLDVALIGCAQAVEHYEIARYGTLRAWAHELGHEEAYQLLHKTLEEEEAADSRLNDLAEELNPMANEEASEDDDEDEEEAPPARKSSRQSRQSRQSPGARKSAD